MCLVSVWVSKYEISCLRLLRGEKFCCSMIFFTLLYILCFVISLLCIQEEKVMIWCPFFLLFIFNFPAQHLTLYGGRFVLALTRSLYPAGSVHLFQSVTSSHESHPLHASFLNTVQPSSALIFLYSLFHAHHCPMFFFPRALHPESCLRIIVILPSRVS